VCVCVCVCVYVCMCVCVYVCMCVCVCARTPASAPRFGFAVLMRAQCAEFYNHGGFTANPNYEKTCWWMEIIV
jgi:hypothetical protein